MVVIYRVVLVATSSAEQCRDDEGKQEASREPYATQASIAAMHGGRNGLGIEIQARALFRRSGTFHCIHVGRALCFGLLALQELGQLAVGELTMI